MIEVRQLHAVELETVDARLPLSRLEPGEEASYVVAWDGDEPIGHAYLALTETELGVPEVQDVYVMPERRREGVATALMRAAERLAAERGHRHCSLSFGVGNDAARALYERLGYRDAGVPPKRVQGTIEIRGEPVEVDDTLVYLVRDLAAEGA